MPPFEFRGNGPPKKGQKNGPRPEFTFRAARLKTAERPLLQGKRETTPEMLTMDGASENQAPKFASLDDLSDSEEAEMDFSDDSDEEDSRPSKRRAVAADSSNTPIPAPAPPPPVPKWSNPDPYTALPPPDESTQKRRDVVKLIRKAKIQNTLAQTKEKDAVTENDDFISLGALDDLSGQDPGGQAPENAPTGPRSMQTTHEAGATPRKRKHDANDVGLAPKTSKPAAVYNRDASIVNQWMTFPGQNATPWVTDYPLSPELRSAILLDLVQNSFTDSPRRLHNEILDFYHWVRPQHYEQHVRDDLIERMNKLFKKRYGNVQIRAFGSFASGLYLPIADIDCVLMSKSFAATGRRSFGERKGQVWAFAAFLRDSGLVVPGSVEAIPFARVPIIKFVDRLTGLRVDMSFDNDSGIVANHTFQEWKREYPMMPVIVSVIKQFLLLRGLNEVPTGGLGGFSITCLVMSLLQHLPHHRTQSFASILLDFLNFYGNIFDYERVGIRMSPPGYFNKVCHFNLRLQPVISHCEHRSSAARTVLQSEIQTIQTTTSRAVPGRSNSSFRLSAKPVTSWLTG